MTVKELIKELKEYDEDKEVIIAVGYNTQYDFNVTEERDNIVLW